jgi:hypothetical protein
MIRALSPDNLAHDDLKAQTQPMGQVNPAADMPTLSKLLVYVCFVLLNMQNFTGTGIYWYTSRR